MARGSSLPMTTRVGIHEVLDRRTLAQELGIADDGELLAVMALGLDDLADHLPGPDRYSALGDNDLVAGQMGADRCGHFPDEGQIGGAIRPRGGTDGDKDGSRVFESGPQLGGKAEPTLVHVLTHQGLETRLVDGYLSLLERFDLVRDFVHTDDIHPEVGKTGPGDETDVSCAYDANIHRSDYSLVRS